MPDYYKSMAAKSVVFGNFFVRIEHGGHIHGQVYRTLGVYK